MGRYGIVHCAGMCYELGCKTVCRRKELHNSLLVLEELVARYGVYLNVHGSLMLGDIKLSPTTSD